MEVTDRRYANRDNPLPDSGGTLQITENPTRVQILKDQLQSIGQYNY
jgi:hypothetical protein